MKELGHQVIFLVVERRSTEGTHSECIVQRPSLLVLFLERCLARLVYPLCDTLHRPIQRFVLPVGCIGSTVFHLRPALLIDDQLVARRPFRTKTPLTYRTIGITFDINDLVVLDVDQLTTTNCAIGADAAKNFRILNTRLQLFVVTWLSVRSAWVRHLVKSDPSLLFYQGQFLSSKMKTERVTEGEIRTAVRQQGIAKIEDVEAVVLETDGTLTVVGSSMSRSASALANVNNYPPPKTEEERDNKTSRP